MRVDTDWCLLTRCLAHSRESICSARSSKPKARRLCLKDPNLITSMICLQISCWRVLYPLLQVDRMGGCAQFWQRVLASPAARAAVCAACLFLHSSIGIRTGVPDSVPYRRYLQNGISSFFILQNYSNRGLICRE